MLQGHIKKYIANKNWHAEVDTTQQITLLQMYKTNESKQQMSWV